MKTQRSRSGVWPALLFAIALGTSGPAARAQESGSPSAPPPPPESEAQRGTLKRMHEHRSPSTVEAPRVDEVFEGEVWRARLADPDLERREERFGELVERTGRDPGVERIVRAWADEGTTELAWTARLVLREVQSERDAAALLARRRGPRVDPFAVLEARLNGILARPGARRGATSGVSPGDGSPAPSAGQDVPGARSFRLEIGPNGARLEVQDGGAESDGQAGTVFEAPTFEQLLLDHPDIAAELGGMWFVSENGAFTRDQLFGALRGREPFPFEEFWSDESGALRTDILGIQMRDLDAGRLLADGSSSKGLLVERILPGTIAHVVGLRRGDLLLMLNDVTLRTGDDVSRVIRERVPEEPLLIRYDRDGEQGTLVWKPVLGGDD